jgi:ATP-binding cassette subfamily B multidrug efflux pump
MSDEPTTPPGAPGANGNGRVSGNGKGAMPGHGADDIPTEVDAAIDAELAAIEALAAAGEGDATGAGSAGAASAFVEAEETAFEKAQRESADDTPKPQEPRTGMAARFQAAGMPAEKSEDFKGSAGRLIARLRPERVKVVGVLALAVASVALSVTGPKILGNATNTIIAGVRSPAGIDYPELHKTLLTVAAIYIASAIMAYTQAYMLAGVVQRTMFRLRADVEDKLNRLPLSYVDTQPRGDLLSRVTNDIDNVAQSLQQTLSQMLTSVLTIIGVIIMMLTISPLLAVVALTTVPLSIWTMKAIAKRSRGRFIAQWRHTGSLNAQVEEAFTGHSLVKVFGQQKDVEQRFSNKNEELFEASFGAQFISGTIQPAMMFFGNLNYVVIAVVGGLQVTSGAMTIGAIQAFIQYSRQFTQPLTQLASMFNVMQSGIASAERVFHLLDAAEESPDRADPLTDERPRGRVEFDHVSFSYDPKNPLIEDLSLIAEPGQTVAIVGPTGAGKTTLVNLIMRFYEIGGGEIRLDGNDISQMKRRELRSNIGMVLQDTWLFGGTIKENIAYGNLDATDEQILEAAKATYVDRFVHSLPEGYDTQIDDEGGTVSAGEKQLLTIARAFLANPTILILDEATSSVDTRTEVLIQRAMAALRSNRTSFVIAHRLSTIRDADTILVMEKGRIVEQGNHDELLAKGGAYHALYNAQFSAPAVEIDVDA